MYKRQTQYYYRVRAENANSYSVWTNSVGARAPVTAGAPLAPTSLTVGASTRASIAVTWGNPGGPAVNNNVVQYSATGSSGPWTTAATLAGNSTAYTITGLLNNRTYWIRVNAINGAGSTSSSVKTGTTLR